MLDLLHLQLRTAQMLVDAQGVIGMRLLGMAGILPTDGDETRRMITEKSNVFASAGLAAAGTILAGRPPTEAYGAALAPIGRATRENSRRLTEWGTP